MAGEGAAFEHPSTNPKTGLPRQSSPKSHGAARSIYMMNPESSFCGRNYLFWSKEMAIKSRVDDVEDIDFGTGNLRESEQLSVLHQIKPEQGHKYRLALLTEFCRPKASYYHWKRGFYRCGGERASCCTAGLIRSWTCVALALQYLNLDDKLGFIDSNLRYRIGYVGMSKSVYGEVSAIPAEFRRGDLIYSNDGNLHLRLGKKVPAWRASPAASAIEREASKWADGSKLREKLGKVLTPEQWGNLIQTGSIAGMDDDM
jgi:hypothetical protein